MSKKILSVFVLVLTLSFSTQVFASLTFTTNTITGTTASTIDLGTGNTLSLQTTSNAPITVGTGLVTLGGNLSVSGRIGIGTTSPNNLLQVVGYVNFNDTDKNTIIGKDAGLNIVTGAIRNTFLGYEAGLYGSGTSTYAAGSNTAVGYQSLRSNTTGDSHTAIGDNALYSNTTGFNNTAIGKYALYSNTTGSRNTAVGEQAGWFANGFAANSNGGESVFIGYNALPLSAGMTNEIVIGASAVGHGGNTATIGDTNISNVYMGGAAGATVNAGKYKLSALNTPPSSASDTGTTGEVRFTATGIYICVATNTWIKATAATW